MSQSKTTLREELEYHAYNHPTIWSFCRTFLCVISFPICCCICCGCQLGYFGRGGGCVKGAYRKRKAQRMERIHWARKEQAFSRRKSLSIDADTTLWTRWRRKQVADQATSPLFSELPREIREIIYGYALTDTGAVYWDTHRERECKFTVLKATPCLPTEHVPGEIEHDVRRVEAGPSGCALLRTCRLIYTEAIPVLYRETQFNFGEYASLRAFSAVTPAARLAEIRSIRVDCKTWPGVWDYWTSTRTKCWKKLRVVCEVHHTDARALIEHLEFIWASTKCVGDYVFCLYMYEHSPADIPGVPSSYAYVDVRSARDWRNLEWQTVQ